MKATTKILIAAAGLSLASAAVVVYAHPGYGPGYGMGPGAMHGYAMGPGYGGANVEDRLAVMKSRLAITPAQEKAWQAFADKSKAQSQSMEKLREKMWSGGVPATAEERAARRTELLKERLAQSEAMTGAVKQLSAALTPEQRAILDRGGFGGGYGPRGGGYGPMGGGYGPMMGGGWR